MTDPKRLADLGSDAPEGLRALLRAGREDLPGAERLQGLASHLGPLFGGATGAIAGAPEGPLGPETLPADPSATAGTAAGSGAVAKALGVGTAIVVLVGGAWLLTRPSPVTTAEPSVSVPAAAEPHISPPELTPAEGASVQSAAPEPTESGSDPVVAKRGVPEPVRSPASGPSESALLVQAQAALSTNPARALALTREHQRRFPKGALAQEREVIAIDALNRIGDPEAAGKRAKDFEHRYPGSAHRRKVQNSAKP